MSSPPAAQQPTVIARLAGLPAAAWCLSWRQELRARLAGEPVAEVVAALVAASLDAVHQDAEAAITAALAARACARLAPRGDLAGRAALRISAWAALANAWRVGGDLYAAERAWRQVGRLARHAAPSGPHVALVHWLRGRLRVDQRRHAEAVADLHAALAEARRLGDRKCAGQYCLELSAALSVKGEPRAARRWVLEAQRQLAGLGEGKLLFFALHQEVRVLVDLGKTAPALSLANALAPHYRRFTGPLGALRGRWLNGRLHAGLGLQREAAVLFEEVRQGFLARDLLYDAALVSLDLALALAELGERPRVRSLAHGMYEVFRAQQIPREASAALLLFAHAALEEQADRALILQAISRLEALRRGAGAA